jgi:solute carrier family 25 (mitochondrial folate transporter), member 32
MIWDTIIIYKIFSGIFSGSISSIICAPLDIIRTQYQVDVKKNKSFKSSFKNIIYYNGISGLYKGCLSNIIAMSVFYGIFFPIYYNSNNFISQYKINYTLQHFLSSLFSASISSIISNPFHVLKTRYHIININKISQKNKVLKGRNKVSFSQSKNIQLRYSKTPNIFNLVKNIYNNEGLFSFYRGVGITLFKNIELGIQLPIYEYSKSSIHFTPFLSVNYAISGFISKIISTSITYPIDTIRTQRRSNNIYTIKTIIKNIKYYNGFSGFYNGYFIYLYRAIPSSVITFVVYELLQS